ncbi:uncharacterized protein LOC120637255 [Pararge aegeria]|uniref:uncharacterized protein LOC120637255 n=1 Tax=Pararge aegeria TaxID=116150 RepID=UPI0019D03F08|nr:uncharacterized protein LOC120637255 [Pararge aegeria]
MTCKKPIDVCNNKPPAMGCFPWLIKNSIIFGTGIYTGVYIAQNYQIDKVEDPKALFEKAQCYVREKLEEFSKKGKD